VILILNAGCYLLEFLEVEVEDKDELLLQTADLRLAAELQTCHPYL